MDLSIKHSILFILLTCSFITFIKAATIPEDQKEKCQRVATSEDDCKIELDLSYFCCFFKAKTVRENEEVSLCGVIKTTEVTKMLINQILDDFINVVKDIISGDINLKKIFNLFYNLAEYGIKDEEVVCPLDPLSKKGLGVFGIIGIILACIIVSIIICRCCCCKKE